MRAWVVSQLFYKENYDLLTTGSKHALKETRALANKFATGEEQKSPLMPFVLGEELVSSTGKVENLDILGYFSTCIVY